MSEYPDEAKRVKPPEHQENGKAKRILIVEDDRLSMTLLSDFLNAHGYTVLKTSEGLDAINLARDPDGYKIAWNQRLRRDPPAQTGQADQSHSDHCRNCFCDVWGRNQGFGERMRCVYHEPVNVDELLRTVESYLPSSFP